MAATPSAGGARLVQRAPDRAVPARKWQPPHGREVLERLLAALREWEPGGPVISLDEVYQTLEDVLGDDSYLSGPELAKLDARLREHLVQLVPVLRQKAGGSASHEEQRAIGRARRLRERPLPVTHSQARAHVRGLATAVQSILYLLVEATAVEEAAPQQRQSRENGGAA
ncbi:DUF6415 family natural product biosynthesis protein [Streptomyces aidingensis]|uniref:Uncharacterized protein n=1 Tax=Streptomyces aidingensis TaxID=910347 RepID=A0A1I1S8H6_9ACTN|nr:DUF6415 family natural product biosynthesis protein [Streptomyces aidingensis]SFD42814.1 hypothetical protein SAMN05421773_11522 [Streptomyces aidingensis]